MEDILRNLANLDLINFCKENNIPPNGYEGEGTHAIKNRRGTNGKQFYSLISNTTGRAIVTVIFHKMQVPTHMIHERGQI